MSRVCEISGKSVMSGNNVSHAKNRTRRKFLPNLQNVKLYSKILDAFISMRICVRSLKTVEKNGGLDNYLMKSSNRVLAPEAQAIKKTMLKAGKNQSENI
ncbi:50S ribosomal protein L28 [Alphaproteobacteria bacterium]|nr:50S ribosomal protein L28 [Alphaproteobacteria bacterium]MDB9869917.1 50S ribosomal protein L28 [Alphaproteobacteria bacterium]MDC1209829.1 50S ribosomal protein L28 [Pseudomonadota bacterium]